MTEQAVIDAIVRAMAQRIRELARTPHQKAA